jgi:agmatinase
MSDDANGFPPFLGSELTAPGPGDALFHVLPVPWERTVSYGGGTALGPSAILRASWQLEVWDGHSAPAKEGIYTRPPVVVSEGPDQVLERIAGEVAEILSLGKVPVAVGGEHTVTLGVVNGFLQAGIQDLGVVQIDAHADLRDTYDGDPFSHACVMRRIAELGIPIFQLGVRALCEEELRAREDYGIRYLDAETLVPEGTHRIELPADFPSRVFFTIDVDGLDPSIFPATGTPVPGGLGWYQTLNLFESVALERQVLGFDLMELAPIRGFHCYDFAAALLVYKLMGVLQRS